MIIMDAYFDLFIYYVNVEMTFVLTLIVRFNIMDILDIV